MVWLCGLCTVHMLCACNPIGRLVTRLRIGLRRTWRQPWCACCPGSLSSLCVSCSATDCCTGRLASVAFRGGPARTCPGSWRSRTSASSSRTGRCSSAPRTLALPSWLSSSVRP
uniref:Secreted protein n=1 Tax=Ixodes ricinus TaxID=34613 RepID=A0A147BAJ4_IXORI